MPKPNPVATKEWMSGLAEEWMFGLADPERMAARFDRPRANGRTVWLMGVRSDKCRVLVVAVAISQDSGVTGLR